MAGTESANAIITAVETSSFELVPDCMCKV